MHLDSELSRRTLACRLACRRRSGLLLVLLLCAAVSLPVAAEPLASGCAPHITTVRPVPVAAPGEITIATQNLRRLFDDVDDGRGEVLNTAQYQLRLEKLSRQIVQLLRSPDVLAVQEVENLKVLDDLAAAVSVQGGKSYQGVLMQGRDWGGINVGFLVRTDIRVLSREQLLKTRRLDRAALFDRPPLWLRLQTPEGWVLGIVNVHLKSLRGSDDPDLVKKIARKRQRQAEALAEWTSLYFAKPAAEPLVMLGDFNASATPVTATAPLDVTDALGGVDVMGIVQAEGLQDQWPRLPENERYSYVHECHPEALDHVLVSAALQPAVQALAVSRGNAGVRVRVNGADSSALRSSDHDALVLYLKP